MSFFFFFPNRHTCSLQMRLPGTHCFWNSLVNFLTLKGSLVSQLTHASLGFNSPSVSDVTVKTELMSSPASLSKEISTLPQYALADSIRPLPKYFPKPEGRNPRLLALHFHMFDVECMVYICRLFLKSFLSSDTLLVDIFSSHTEITAVAS